MNRTLQKSILLMAALVAVGQCFAAEPTTSTAGTKTKVADLFADEVVAQGKGVKVTRAELDDELVNLKAAAAANNQTINPRQMKVFEAQVLERLIGRQLLNERATAADKTAATTNADNALAMIVKKAGGDEGLARQLRVVDMSLDKLKMKLNLEAVAEAVLQREIKFEVSDDDVKKYYDENPTQFEAPERVRVAHILISTREKDGSEMSDAKKKEQRKLADDLLKRAKGGEDFGKLAKDYSDDPGAKETAGEFGPFPRGTRQVPPEFEAAAFAQDANQISDVVPTQYGFHIIKTLEKSPAKKYELAEVSADVKAGLKRQGMTKQIPAYIDGIKKAANVEILNSDIKKFIEEQQADDSDMDKPLEAPKPQPKKSDVKK